MRVNKREEGSEREGMNVQKRGIRDRRKGKRRDRREG